MHCTTWQGPFSTWWWAAASSIDAMWGSVPSTFACANEGCVSVQDGTEDKVRGISNATGNRWGEEGKEINEHFLPDSLNPGKMGLQVISRAVSGRVENQADKVPNLV
jgi:hypothetical protein